MKRNSNITKIMYSCVTGRAVWIYRGASEEAMRLAYFRARRREELRLSEWSNRVRKHKQGLRRILEILQLNAPKTAVARKGIKQIQSLINTRMCYGRDFLDHIREEQRKRDFDRAIRKQMREQKAPQ